MGYTQKLKTGGYRARWKDPNGDWRSKSFRTEREAARHLRNVGTDLDRGQYLDDRDGKITFEEYAEHYYVIANKRLSRTSYARDRSYLDNHVVPYWGKRSLGKITKPEVERWVVELADDGQSKRVEGASLAPATVEKIYQVFRKVMAAAVEDDILGRLPCPAHPPISRKKRKAVQFLTEGQIAHLAASIEPRYEAMIYVAGYGGFRIGELVALRLNDVDWARNHIRVDEGLTDVDGVLEFEEPKTERARRSVPVADIAMSKLRGHVESVVGWDDPSALLFTSPTGETLRPTNWRRRQWAAATKAAKLPLTPHDLRHTAASIFIASGANPWMLAEILGHSDTRMIDRVYGHLFDKDREELRQRVSERARQAESTNVIDLQSRSTTSATG
jgi:integrase